MARKIKFYYRRDFLNTGQCNIVSYLYIPMKVLTQTYIYTRRSLLSLILLDYTFIHFINIKSSVRWVPRFSVQDKRDARVKNELFELV